MIERLEPLGVQELTLDEQSGVLGGNDVAAGAGRLLGYVWGLIVKAAIEFEYENPRYSGEWMGYSDGPRELNHLLATEPRQKTMEAA